MIGPLEEIIRSIEAGSRRLQELDGIDASRLIGSYGPGKWSGLEILTHIADADLIYLTRFLCDRVIVNLVHKQRTEVILIMNFSENYKESKPLLINQI